MKIVKKIINQVKEKALYLTVAGSLFVMSSVAKADTSQPSFCSGGSCPTISNGDVAGSLGLLIESAMKWTLTLVGALVIIGAIMAIYKQMKHGSENNEHSGMMSTVIYSAIAVVCAICLIAFAWLGLNYTGK